jgi:hypothetical protein
VLYPATSESEGIPFNQLAAQTARVIVREGGWRVPAGCQIDIVRGLAR